MSKGGCFEAKSCLRQGLNSANVIEVFVEYICNKTQRHWKVTRAEIELPATGFIFGITDNDRAEIFNHEFACFLPRKRSRAGWSGLSIHNPEKRVLNMSSSVCPPVWPGWFIETII